MQVIMEGKKKEFQKAWHYLLHISLDMVFIFAIWYVEIILPFVPKEGLIYYFWQ